MKQRSLIPSFEKVELHSADLAAADVIDILNDELQEIKTLANPVVCDSKYLPFLAYAFKVDFWDDRLDIERKRALVQESIVLHSKKGTIWAIERILEVLEVKADTQEWFNHGWEPYYFRIKLEIEEEFPYLNQLKRLIDLYKNVRSAYDIEFDLFLDSSFYIKAVSITDIEVEQSFNLNKSTSLELNAANICDYDAFEDLYFKKDTSYSLTSANIIDIETKDEVFEVQRNTEVLVSPSVNTNIFFGFTGSDVMHLPIPPIEVEANMSQGVALILDMNFSEIESDVFHLDHHNHYEASTPIEVYINSFASFDFEATGINKKITTEARLNNLCFLNLEL